MIALIKALIPGIFLSWIVATFAGSGGFRGGVLMAQHVSVGGQQFYWSWPVFLGGTLLSFAIFKMMD